MYRLPKTVAKQPQRWAENILKAARYVVKYGLPLTDGQGRVVVEYEDEAVSSLGGECTVSQFRDYLYGPLRDSPLYRQVVTMLYSLQEYDDVEVRFMRKYDMPFLPDTMKRRALSSVHYLELADRAHIQQCMLDDHIQTHPVVQFNPKLRRAAAVINEEMGWFYQEVMRHAANKGVAVDELPEYLFDCMAYQVVDDTNVYKDYLTISVENPEDFYWHLAKLLMRQLDDGDDVCTFTMHGILRRESEETGVAKRTWGFAFPSDRTEASCTASVSIMMGRAAAWDQLMTALQRARHRHLDADPCMHFFGAFDDKANLPEVE